MNIVLGGLDFCLVYLDDIIVHSSTFEEHINQLAAKLKSKPSKCHLLRDIVKFLGHIVNAEGISTDPEKIEKVTNWPTPTCVSDVRSFMEAKVCKEVKRTTAPQGERCWHWSHSLSTSDATCWERSSLYEQTTWYLDGC
jgi:hypothetical protein